MGQADPADGAPVITAAGASAGIDVALRLVERLASPERAEEVASCIHDGRSASWARSTAGTIDR